MDNEEYDRHCGKHSGIPDCCIEFFIAVWCPSFMDAKHVKHREAIEKHEKVNKVTFGYIPCKACLKANVPPVKVKSCKCDKPGGWLDRFRKRKAKKTGR